ncbi:MAG: 2-O-(6-phospho-alpha-D-mannosyl)-D-glycerate hydrolase, partial [Chloroflexota bacterium]|nr:2-O-(6-phospho-alpha-D-mannosyl)-D-glycerate hydrolase [Chloroflexota bacterium]
RWGDPSAMNFDMELALDRLTEAVKLLKPRAATPNLLLMNGIDHAEADPNAPAVIAHANAVLPDMQIEHGTLSEYVARIRREGGASLPAFSGEFNRGRYAVILQGVYSSRMHLKQANERVQTLLERYAEPLAAWAWTLEGADAHPVAFLDYAWRRLLQNHPHDDICGCSVDAVHRENMTRYADAEQVAAVIARDSFRRVVRHADRTAQPGTPFVFFNPLAWPRTGVVETNLLFDRDDPRARDFQLVDAAGKPAFYQILAEGEHFDMEVLKANRKREVRVALAVDALPACGYRVYYAVPATGDAAPRPDTGIVLPTDDGMLNRYLRVAINPDGSLNILDRERGRRYDNVGYFEDTEDAGDLYDYSPARTSETVTSLGGKAQARLTHGGPFQVTYEISLTLSLPSALMADRGRRRKTRVACPVTMAVTLRSDSRTVEIRTELDNRVRDHRLRVCFPTGLTTDHASAGGHFDVLTRPIDQEPGPGWVQPPVPTKHQRGFVDVSDGQAGLAVFSRGLPEYEALRDGQNTIAVTLLRCVDAISRGDMLSRPSHAGMPCETPEGQCQGRYTFEYAVQPHAGDWRAIYRAAAEFEAPVYQRRGDETEGLRPDELWTDNSPDALAAPVSYKPPALAGELPGECSFLRLTPETLVLSAVKRSERGDALIVRFYNPTTVPTQARLRVYRPIRSAQIVNLNEEAQADLALADPHTVALPVGAKQVCTVALRSGVAR